MSRWTLTPETIEQSGQTVQQFLELIDNQPSDEDLREIDLSLSSFNPYTLCKYLEELGYEKGIQDDNGWQLDFWIPFRKDGHTPVEIYGTGIVCEFGLREMEYDWKQKREEREQDLAKTCDTVLQSFREILKSLDDKSEGANG